MPRHSERNLAITIECRKCHKLFHPRFGRQSQFCSRQCYIEFTVKQPDEITSDLIPQPDLLQSLPNDPLQELQEQYDEGQRLQHLADTRLANQYHRTGERVLILAGHGSYLGVEYDGLVAHNGRTHGAAATPREIFHRGLHDVKQIIWLDRHGTLTLSALQWCRDQGVAVSILDPSGSLLACTVEDTTPDIALRRAQYAAQSNGKDVQIARAIIQRKLVSQRTTISQHPEFPTEARDRALDALDMALSWLAVLDPIPPHLETLDGLRVYEGRCAKAYWLAFERIPVRWIKSDLKRIPSQWLTIGSRRSPISINQNARHAVQPAQAIINYALGMLTTQARQALITLGFDPVCGIGHADKPGRDSLVYDLMEPERAAVDDLVLRFIAQTTFHAADFCRHPKGSPDGTIHLHPQMARLVIAACRIPQSRLDQHTKWLRDLLLT